MNNSLEENIYLDYAAATPIDSDILRIYKKELIKNYANASAMHQLGVQSRESLEMARYIVANTIAATPETIIFTRGGTESINLAILGIAHAHCSNGNHIITTKVEHDAVLSCMKHLEQEGFKITYLDVDNSGNISLKDVQAAITDQTILISIMSVQNEIGTIYPIQDIGKLILQYRKKHCTAYPLFHTDACQAPNYIDLHVERMHIDLLSLNGSKIYAPKSSGILYVRKGVVLKKVFFGGNQEKSLRPGTEDVASSIAFAHAFVKAQSLVQNESKRLLHLQQKFISLITKEIPNSILNGPTVQSNNRIANNINISFLGAEAETVLIYLDAAGVFAGSGSACATDKDEPSHVLKACHATKAQLTSSIRFTFGRQTTWKQLQYTVKHLKKIITRVRSIEQIV